MSWLRGLGKLKLKAEVDQDSVGASPSTSKPSRRQTLLPSSSVPQELNANPSDDDGRERQERHGIFVLYPNESADLGSKQQVDIVAVHGLNGDAWNTWTDKQSKNLWLLDDLPAIIPKARIMTFGYDSSVFFSKSVSGIDNFATDLLNRLRMKRNSPQEQKRPLIFICHSMGGLVVKKALVQAHEARNYYGSILDSTVGILFMGTPHCGSNIASLGRVVGQIANAVAVTPSPVVRVKLLKNLELDSETLQTISRQFVQRAADLKIISFIEQVPLQPLNSLVVPEISAAMYISNERIVPMGADHKSICQFPNPRNQRFLLVVDALLELIEQASPTTILNRQLSNNSSASPQTLDPSSANTAKSALPARSPGEVPPLPRDTRSSLMKQQSKYLNAMDFQYAIEDFVKDRKVEKSTKLVICGLRRSTFRDGRNETVEFEFNSDMTIATMLESIRETGFGISLLRIPEAPNAVSSVWEDYLTTPVKVSSGRACYNPSEGLIINESQTLANFFSKVYPNELKVDALASNPGPSASNDIISVRPSRGNNKLDITLERTLRLPDDNSVSMLPPSMGRFPLYDVSSFAERLPNEIAGRGGIFFPMYEREAMWISFQTSTLNEDGIKQYAIRPFVGGVNGISGEPMIGDMATLIRRFNRLSNDQDYLVVPPQRWLDGIAISPGIVKQFVATPMELPGEVSEKELLPFQGTNGMWRRFSTSASFQTSIPDASVEFQVTGKDSVGGLQLEIIPEFDVGRMSFSRSRNCIRGDQRGHEQILDILQTPLQQGLREGDVIHMKDLSTRRDERQKMVCDLWDEVHLTSISESSLYLEAIQNVTFRLTVTVEYANLSLAFPGFDIDNKDDMNLVHEYLQGKLRELPGRRNVSLYMRGICLNDPEYLHPVSGIENCFEFWPYCSLRRLPPVANDEFLAQLISAKGYSRRVPGVNLPQRLSLVLQSTINPTHAAQDKWFVEIIPGDSDDYFRRGSIFKRNPWDLEEFSDGPLLLALDKSSTVTMESLRRDIEKCSSKSLDGFKIYPIYSQNGKVLRDGFPNRKHLEKRLSLARQEAFGETPKIFIWISETMQIFIKTLTGKTITFRVYPTATIRSLKERIGLTEGVPANQHHLIFAGIKLDPDRTLDDYGVKKESTLIMILVSRGGLGVWIRTSKGDRFQLEVERHCTVLDIKRRLSPRFSVAEERQEISRTTENP